MVRKITLHFMNVRSSTQTHHIQLYVRDKTKLPTFHFISLLITTPSMLLYSKTFYSLIQYDPKIPPYTKTCLILSIIQMYRKLYSFSFLRLRLWRRFAGPASKLDHGRMP